MNEDFYKMSSVAIKVFNETLPPVALERRKLQSIAFHLKVGADIFKITNEELIVEIGNALIRIRASIPIPFEIVRTHHNLHYFYEYDALIEKLTIIANLFDRVPEMCFGFLLRFSKKIIDHKLRWSKIFGLTMVNNHFNNNQAPEVILAYLCDASEYSVAQIVRDFQELEYQTQTILLIWGKYIAWFEDDKDREKLRAALFYSGKRITKKIDYKKPPDPKMTSETIILPPIEDINDIKLIFHHRNLPDVLKLFVYEKIRDLYHKRSSRAESKKQKKSCSFTLTPEAKELINILAKECNIKGKDSALLNLIFTIRNKEWLTNKINEMYFLTR